MNGTATPSVASSTPPWKLPPAWVGIVSAGLLAHGLVPLTDYVLWDGWWYAADLARPDGPTTMERLFHEVGRPLDMWFYLPLRWLGGNSVAWAKWLGTAAWIAAAVCIATVLRSLARLPGSVATAVAMLVVALPVFDLLGELALWMNTACVLLFWLAWVLVSRLPDLAGWRAIAARISALLLFFVSFDLNSNLVMFYAFAVAVAGLRLPDIRPATLLARLPRLAIRHADFLAMPVLFWLWKTVFTPVSGFYATGYNQPSLAPGRLTTGYLGLVLEFVLNGLVELVSSPMGLIAALATALAAIAVTQRLKDTACLVAPTRGLAFRLIGLGLFLLAAAAFPYIAVGQRLASEGWLSRNCILCPLPVAMIACGSLLLMNNSWLPSRPMAWLGGVAALLTLGIGGCAHNYLSYQALGAKQCSIREKLSVAILQSTASVVQLRDYFQIPKTIPYYAPIIWTYMADHDDWPPTTFVFETAVMAPDAFPPGPDGRPQRVIPQVPLTAGAVDQMITATTMPYTLEKVPRTGPQILVTVEPTLESASAADLGMRYLWLSWLQPQRLDEFLQGLTNVEAYELPRIE